MRLLEQTAGVCVYCGHVLPLDKMTVDHIVPASDGGSGQEDNLVACCTECNSSKDDLPVWRYVDTFMTPKKARAFENRVRALTDGGRLPERKVEILLRREPSGEVKMRKKFGPKALERLEKETLGTCVFCGRALSSRTWTLIVERSDGGSLAPSNAVSACPRCIEAKANMGAAEFVSRWKESKSSSYRNRVHALVEQGWLPRAKGERLAPCGPFPKIRRLNLSVFGRHIRIIITKNVYL